MKDYYHLFIAMCRTGILGYGGGPSVIPLFRHEAVVRYRWMTDEEFGDMLAFANALPGPIATKLAAQLGYQRKGILGAILSVLAHIFPSTLAIIGLLSVLYTLKDSEIIAGVIAAVRPVIAVLLGLMAYDFCKRAWSGLGRNVALFFIVVAFIFLAIINVHPAITIIVFLFYGAFHLRFKDKWGKKRAHSDS